MLRSIKLLLAVCIILNLSITLTYAQDTIWQQVPGGWVDDIYYENLFLGSSFYTRISLADIDGGRDLDMFFIGGGRPYPYFPGSLKKNPWSLSKKKYAFLRPKTGS
ncbi:MAG: hypothetical protein JSU85_10280 [Candidatus Zixiibacteriota bacterium]|nr:MAG: hypothetical protein JSU85_10280 [candidate division Zixibacteria bacterium]